LGQEFAGIKRSRSTSLEPNLCPGGFAPGRVSEADQIPLQAIRIGDIGIAACPCEVFAETGLAIKKQSPLKHTFTMELANGFGGYLPTPQQHTWGGYETWPARSSHLEIEAEPKIRSKLLSLLQQAAGSR
jgi:hypothetical protein